MFHIQLNTEELIGEYSVNKYVMEPVKCELCPQPTECSRMDGKCEHVICDDCSHEEVSAEGSCKRFTCPLCSKKSSVTKETHDLVTKTNTSTQAKHVVNTPRPRYLTKAHAFFNGDVSSKTRKPYNTLQNNIAKYGLWQDLESSSQCSVHWGIDVCSSGGDTDGDMLLADWSNEQIKHFKHRPDNVKSLNVKGPVDVVCLSKEIIAVSHGGKSESMTFLAMSKGNLKYHSNVDIGMYCYSITLNCKGGYGIAMSQRKDGDASLAKIRPTCKVTELDIGSAKRFLVPHGGILYHPNTENIYTTAETWLTCINVDTSHVEFRQFYPQDGGGVRRRFPLGYLTCNSDGSIFAASDKCVLCVSQAGTLLSVIRSELDPYCIAVLPDTRSLVLAGRGSRFDILNINKEDENI